MAVMGGWGGSAGRRGARPTARPPRRLQVLHRRANLCRPRAVHEMRAGALPGQPPGYFTLHLRTQAGAYIKEFVHSACARGWVLAPGAKRDSACEDAARGVHASG